jgi:hypothetical protein
MKMNGRKMMMAASSDHTMATVARVVAGALGVMAAIMIVRSLPDLVRYIKMERM